MLNSQWISFEVSVAYCYLLLFFFSAHLSFPPFLSSSGSQGAALQADAPSQLAHVRAAMDVYLTQVKDSAKRALDQLDDTEYKELK